MEAVVEVDSNRKLKGYWELNHQVGTVALDPIIVIIITSLKLFIITTIITIIKISLIITMTNNTLSIIKLLFHIEVVVVVDPE